jgi:hypothetical protein
MTEIEIPYLLRGNDRDRRGLPIPYIVYRDKDGDPHFTINEAVAVKKVLDRKLCALCGKPHKLGAMWFTGGAGAAFHEEGLFIDPPAHEACGTYAMRVCPFIAAPNYSKRIDHRTLTPEKTHEAALVQDSGMDPKRPPFFVFARASGYQGDRCPAGAVVHPAAPTLEGNSVLVKRRADHAGQAAELLEGTEYDPALKWWPDYNCVEWWP